MKNHQARITPTCEKIMLFISEIGKELKQEGLSHHEVMEVLTEALHRGAAASTAATISCTINPNHWTGACLTAANVYANSLMTCLADKKG